MNEEEIKQLEQKYNFMVVSQIKKAGSVEAWKKGLAERGRKGGLVSVKGKKKKPAPKEPK